MSKKPRGKKPTSAKRRPVTKTDAPTLPPINGLGEATEADLKALDAAGTAILDEAGPPLETIGEGMAVLTASIGERVAAAGDALPLAFEIPAGATARKQRKVCRLTMDERLRISTQLCEFLTERDGVEEDKKRTAKEFSDTLAGLDATITKLKNQFETGSEEREIDVYDVRDIGAKKVRTYVAGSNELIDERDMIGRELQMELDERIAIAKHDGRSDAEIAELEAAFKAETERKEREAGATAMTDEQNLATTPEEAEAMRALRLEQEARDRITVPADAEITESTEPGRVEFQPDRPLLSSDGIKKGRDRNREPITGTAETEAAGGMAEGEVKTPDGIIVPDGSNPDGSIPAPIGTTPDGESAQ